MSVLDKTNRHAGATMGRMRRILDFITANARLLDRRRAELALGDGDPEAALAVLAGYRNADGGFGWALEPDLRAPASQPVAALHAFEVLEEVAPVTSPLATGLLDWLDAVALPGGALPFALPGAASAGLGADVGVRRHGVALAAHDGGGAGDRAPGRAPRPGGGGTPVAAARHGLGDGARSRRSTGPAARSSSATCCSSSTRSTRGRSSSGSARTCRRTGRWPWPAASPTRRCGRSTSRPSRAARCARCSTRAAIEADLDRLEAEQHDDGGWDVDWAHWSPAGGLEWRGWATVRALRILRANGRV